MNSEKDHLELDTQHLHQLGLETQSQEEAVSLPFFDDTFRWKVIYLFSGTILLAAWWLVYDNLLAFSRLVTYQVLPFREGTHLGSTIEFFIFEVPKVLLLLTLIVFFVGVIRSFFTPERTRKILAGSRESVGHVLAALLGVVTPFCSVLLCLCSWAFSPRECLLGLLSRFSFRLLWSMKLPSSFFSGFSDGRSRGYTWEQVS